MAADLAGHGTAHDLPLLRSVGPPARRWAAQVHHSLDHRHDLGATCGDRHAMSDCLPALPPVADRRSTNSRSVWARAPISSSASRAARSSGVRHCFGRSASPIRRSRCRVTPSRTTAGAADQTGGMIDAQHPADPAPPSASTPSDAGDHPCLKIVVRSVDMSWSAAKPFSRPWPDFFMPPKGSSMPPPAPKLLM